MLDSGLLAWVTYLVASLFLIVLFWAMSSNWRPAVLARVLRVWLAIVLLTPAYIEPGSAQLAPAWVVTLFALLGDEMAVASQGYVPLLAAIAIATALIAVGALVQLIKSRESHA